MTVMLEHATVAQAMPLGLNDKRRVRDSFPAYLDLVRRQLRREYREEDLSTLGLSIFTAFDPLLQRQVERSTTAILDAIDSGGELESATVVTRFDSGEVAALVGDIYRNEALAGEVFFIHGGLRLGSKG